jgi:hypothetical protein
MNISLQKISAIVIMVGSVLFLIAAFSPISRVFPEPSAVRKLEIIVASPNAWFVAQIFFGLGAMLTVIGIAIIGYQSRAQPFAWFIHASVIILFLGASLRLWHVYARAEDPAAFTEGSLSAWPVVLYWVLTPAGLAVFGVALLRSALPQWVGWVMIASMALFLLLTVIFGDIPPFVYYAITLLTGVMLYRAGSRVVMEAS